MLTFERVALVLVIAVILSIGSCMAYKGQIDAETSRVKADKVKELIESGVDPIAAGCAINNQQSTQCVLAAIKDK